jgi:hypothetical protein
MRKDNWRDWDFFDQNNIREGFPEFRGKMIKEMSIWPGCLGIYVAIR